MWSAPLQNLRDVSKGTTKGVMGFLRLSRLKQRTL